MNEWNEIRNTQAPEHLGALLKPYIFSLGFNEYLLLMIFQKGALLFYAGSIKCLQNKSEAFNIANTMKNAHRIESLPKNE
jgi:hypothetical protein